MNEIAIIIPSRLAAERFPNKPLKLIDKKEMILHVYDSAVKADENVYVATPDELIIEAIKKYGGKAVRTSLDHKTGTDRIFEVFDKILKRKPKIIINLQGDMPNIDPNEIKKLISYMKRDLCDIATLASTIRESNDIQNSNIVKVVTKKKIEEGNFCRALDFFRSTNNKTIDQIYHHVGIYAFTNEALIRYVDLKRSKLELERKLEQLRALENNMTIDVGFINSYPLSVDTENDFKKIKKIMEKNG